MSVGLWAAVGVISGAGTLARFLVDKAVGERIASDFPWGTFTVNMTGSFVAGLVLGVSLAGTALLLVGTAGLGSYTTFSTWLFESHRLGEEGSSRLLVRNLVASLLCGFGVAVFGYVIGQRL